jgi:hypothetical protein
LVIPSFEFVGDLMLDAWNLATPLALPLFVAGVGADDVNAALAAHDLTVLANPLNARTNLHGAPPSPAY